MQVRTITNHPAADTAPGWYGKLLTLGDFAQRRLPQHLLDICDSWLASGMRSARERLGERWLEQYLTAAPMRFAWAPGVIDSQWWFGLLMPSCDNVGRYFPLIITQPRPRPPVDVLALEQLEDWYDHLAKAALQTLAANDGLGATVDELEAALHAAPPWLDAADPPLLPFPAQPGQRLQLGRRAPLALWLQAMAASELSARLVGCTLWWRVSEVAAHNGIDIVHGLPRAQQFSELFIGTEDREGDVTVPAQPSW